MVKVLIIGNQDCYKKYFPLDIPITLECEIIFVPRETSEQELIEKGRDCEFIAVDPMATVSGKVIHSMKKLRLIHSEGVGYNGIDIDAATECNVVVCNGKGINAGAVAEQSILLMLAVLRNVVGCDTQVRMGNQIQVKEKMMLKGIRELSECHVGIIGLGDIGLALARRLVPFECKVSYWSRNRKDETLEKKYNLHYLSLEDLISTCDIVSLHTAVTEETRNMVNRDFLNKMKDDAILINTARGDLVDNEALIETLNAGRLFGVGLDTLSPEPVLEKHPLLHLNESSSKRIVFSPHIGGITTGTLQRSHRLIWQSFQDVMDGKKPQNIVNG